MVDKEELKKVCGGSASTYPQIFINEKHIGSYFDFQDYIEEEYEPILAPTLNRFTVFPLKYPELWELYKKAQMSNWTAEEVDLSKDLDDWKTLNDNEQKFIKYILAFFAGSDGIVFENINNNFADEVQISEARSFYAYQCHNEMVHGETYSKLIDKYRDDKFKLNNLNDFNDRISIEEPLEIIIKYNDKGIWVEKTISITMRTPGDDEDLVRGFLFNEKVIEKIDYIEKIEITGVPTEQYGLKNKIIVTINNSKNIDIDKIKRNFLTNSSCGVCGKTSLDSLEIIKKDKILKSIPKITKETIMSSPDKLRQNQSEFSKTGGIHASGLFTAKGDIVAIKEDVGRHNALDKLIGHALDQKLLNTNTQFLTCSGRLNFDLVQKALMANIGVLIGVGAPTSLAIDLANRFDMTLVGFVKGDSFNIYSSSERIK